MKSRKIQRTKSGSYQVTLPKSWVEKAGLKKGDSIKIATREDGSLTVGPSSKVSRPENKFSLNFEDYPDTRSLTNMVRAGYMQGGEEIRVLSSNGSIVEEKEALRSVISDLIGGEVALDRPDKFVIQVLVDPTKFSISNIVYRISDLISSIQGDSMRALKVEDAALASDASNRGKEINRLYRLMLRQLTISVDDKNVADSIGVGGTTEAMHYAIAARDLSRMGYHIVKVAEKVGDLRMEMDPDLMDSLINISKIVSKMRENSVKALLKADFKLANEVFADMDRIKELDQNITKEILNKLIEEEASYALIFLNRNLRRAAGHAVAISDVATNKAALLKKKAEGVN